MEIPFARSILSKLKISIELVSHLNSRTSLSREIFLHSVFAQFLFQRSVCNLLGLCTLRGTLPSSSLRRLPCVPGFSLLYSVAHFMEYISTLAARDLVRAQPSSVFPKSFTVYAWPLQCVWVWCPVAHCGQLRTQAHTQNMKEALAGFSICVESV